MAAGGKGWAFAGASIDLRVGGRYRLAMTDPQEPDAGGICFDTAPFPK